MVRYVTYDFICIFALSTKFRLLTNRLVITSYLFFTWMPKSSRNQVVSLTRTEKKGRENKERIADEIRASMDKYAYIWVLNVQNMRNNFLKEIRQAWEGSRIMFGRTKLMQKVIGKSVEDEYLDNVHELSEIIAGDVGLLFTNEEPDVVQSWFASYVKTDYARSGQLSPIEFIVPEGVVYSTGGRQPIDDDVPMAHSLESTLRQLGMPTRLVKGKVVLTEPFKVCKKGESLNSKQAQLLKQFGYPCAEFRIKLLGMYSKNGSKTEIF